MNAQQYRECADRHEHAAQLLRAAADALEPASDHVKALVDAGVIPSQDEDTREYLCPITGCGKYARVAEVHSVPTGGRVARHECMAESVDDGVVVLVAAVGDNLQDRFQTAAMLS